MQKLIGYSLLIIICFFTINAKASHIVGGEMYYDYLGYNTDSNKHEVRINLKIYRDCFNGLASFDNPANVSVFDGNGLYLYSIQLSSFNVIAVNNSLYPCANLTNSNFCVEQAWYQQVIYLASNISGYHFTYQRCCRNNTITNIQNSGDVGATFTSYIPSFSTISSNSSPRFSNLPPSFLCINKPVQLDFSAFDIDGDLLTYQLCDPYTGASDQNPSPAGNQVTSPPYNSVDYEIGFNTNNPILTSNGILVNISTGVLSFTPNAFGQFVFAVCVNEWRNGSIISKTQREFQFNVIACSFPNAKINLTSIIPNSITSDSTFILCNGNTIGFNNGSSNANNFNWNFGVLNSSTDVSTVINPIYTFPDTGDYIVQLISSKNAITCSDTDYIKVKIQPAFSPFISSPLTTQCLTGNSFSYNVVGSYNANAQFVWNVGANTPTQFFSGTALTNISYSQAGYFPVLLNATQFNCKKNDFINVRVVELPIFDSIKSILPCTGLKQQYQIYGKNISNSKWDFNLNSNANPLINGTIINYTSSDSGITPIKIYYNSFNVCFDSVTVYVRLTPKLIVDFNLSSLNLCEDNNLIKSDIIKSNLLKNANYTWILTNANLIENKNDTALSFNYTIAGNYTVDVNASNFGCKATKQKTIRIFKNPNISFANENQEGCIPFSTKVISNIFSENSYVLNYYDGNKLYYSRENPIFTFNDTGAYFPTVTLINKNGCVDTVTYKAISPLYARPIPSASFELLDYEKYLFDKPLIHLRNNTTKPYDSVFYDWGVYPKKITTLAIDSFLYPTAGDYEITQLLINQYGCKNKTRRYVYISDQFNLYIPNAFTPNSDGLNDFFSPVNYGLTKIDFEIFDRWGNIIFNSIANGNVWNGTKNGLPLQADNYVYVLYYYDYYNVKRKKQGIINLIR